MPCSRETDFAVSWEPGWEVPDNLDLAPFARALNSFPGLAVLEKAIDVHLQLLVLIAEDSRLVAKPLEVPNVVKPLPCIT